MPFIRKTDPKNSQLPRVKPTFFIGRGVEVNFFTQNILAPKDPSHNIIAVSGQGGVGKSTLLTRFIEEAHSSPCSEYCLIATIDERQSTPASIMEKISDQLRAVGSPLDKFEEELSRYKTALRKIQTERETERDVLIGKTTDLVGEAIEEVPIVGGLLREGIKTASEYLVSEYRTRQLLKDAERLEDPIDDLTRAFLEDLNRLADSQVLLTANREKRCHRILLFIDTFEQLANQIASWLLDYVLETNISNQVVLVIAGRDRLEHSSLEYSKRWLRYLDEQTIYPINLDPFSEEETRLYLAQREITEPDQVATILQLSRGLPLYLSLLTSRPQGDLDPTGDVIANFLRWIPEHEHSKRRLAEDAAIFSRPFDQDDLTAFTYVPEEDRASFYHWLIEQPFVQGNSQDGRYRYHDLARELFRRHLSQRSPREYKATVNAIATYYHRLLGILEEENHDFGQMMSWQELSLALAYQLLLLSDQSSQIKVIEQILKVNRYTDDPDKISRILREFLQEGTNNLGSSSSTHCAKALLGLIEGISARKHQQVATALTFLIEKVARERTFPSNLRAVLYAFRGVAHFNLKHYQEAVRDYTCIIELNPKLDLAYISRGRTYLILKEYMKAGADFDQAIELKTQDDEAYYGRGLAYLFQDKPQQAIANFDQAIVLAPNNSSYYRSRGEAYSALEEYKLAIADYSQAIALKPKDAMTRFQRGQAELAIEEYQQAIEDFTQAIKLKPKDAKLYANRAVAYGSLEEYQQSLADFDQAIKLNPKVAEYYGNRGQTYILLDQFKRAITDLDQAVKLDPKNPWPYERRWAVYYFLEDYSQALININNAIRLDPRNPFLFERRANVYLSLGNPTRAIDDCNQAINLKPEYAYAYYRRGRAYQDLLDHMRAIDNFNKVLELEPGNIRTLVKRAESYSSMGYYREAVESFDEALVLDKDLFDEVANELGLVLSYLGMYARSFEIFQQQINTDPDDYVALYNRAIVMGRWKGLVEAQAYVEAAHIALIAKLNSDAHGAVLYGLGGLEALAGNNDLALDYLRQATSVEKKATEWASKEIAWQDLRADSRFQSLISQDSLKLNLSNVSPLDNPPRGNKLIRTHSQNSGHAASTALRQRHQKKRR